MCVFTFLSERDSVVFQEDYLQHTSNVWVIVHHCTRQQTAQWTNRGCYGLTLGHRVDQFYDHLGCMVTWSCLHNTHNKLWRQVVGLTFPPMRMVLGTTARSGFAFNPVQYHTQITQSVLSVCMTRLTVIEGDDMEDIEQLSLVFMDPLDLHVKQRGWVDLHIMCLLQVLRKLPLVLLHTHTQLH